MPRPRKNTKRTATRNTPQPTNEPSTTFTIPSIVITDDVLSVTDKTKKDLNELDDNINTSNLPNKYIKLSNEKNIYIAIQPESSSTNAELSKNAVPFKDDTVPSTKDQDSAALITSLTSNNFTPIFAALFQAMTSSIITTTTGSLAANSTTTPTVTNTNMNNTISNNTQLATLFINESKVLFLCIRKPTPELILSLGRECARHLGITELKAGEIKKKGCEWFDVTMSNLPNSSHLRNFVDTDDIFNIFEPQLKQIKKDRLLEDQSSLIMLKNYLVEVILIMVCYFVCKNVDLTIYNNATKIRRTEWRSAIL
ncbi:11595_t:CDS:2, partial [Rhizophagus irregularis]